MKHGVIQSILIPSTLIRSTLIRSTLILFTLVLSLVSQLTPTLFCQKKQPEIESDSNVDTPTKRRFHKVGHAAVQFGMKGQRRVRLEVNGATLRVDRNADGDVGDPGERVLPNDRGEFVTDVLGCDQNGRDGRYTLRAIIKDGKEGCGIESLSVCPVGDIQRFHSTAGFIKLGRDQANAPTLPIHGPLRFVLMDHWTGSTACRTLPRAGGRHEISILVATPVRTAGGEAYVYPNLWVLEGGKLPVVRVQLVSRGGGPVSVSNLKIWQCECARRYRCSFTVPPIAATSKARVRVSFPGWRNGSLGPATFELRHAAGSTSEGRARTRGFGQ